MAQLAALLQYLKYLPTLLALLPQALSLLKAVEAALAQAQTPAAAPTNVLPINTPPQPEPAQPVPAPKKTKLVDVIRGEIGVIIGKYLEQHKK